MVTVSTCTETIINRKWFYFHWNKENSDYFVNKTIIIRFLRKLIKSENILFIKENGRKLIKYK